MITAYHNTQIISNGKIISGRAVLVENGKIAAVVSDNDIPDGTQLIDINGAYLSPGLIDLQVYGSGGKLFGGSSKTGALQQMEADFIKQGTTGFFATIGTNSNTVFEQAIVWASEYYSQRHGNFLGIHLEGPYISPERKGAHSEEYIRKGSLKELQGWIEKGQGVIKMMTIAPELQDDKLMDYLQSQGIIISSGHSNATYAEAKAFLNGRVPAVTHLYNAMPQMHHRNPGIIPAIFETRPFTSIVADGIHVDYSMVALAKRELGNKLFLITDAVTSTTEGNYPLHELRGNYYVMPPNYTLSGSCLTMLKAVQNCVQYCNIALPEAINMASLYPAQLAGLPSKGKIEAGFDADMVVFDNNFQVKNVVFKGESFAMAA